MQDVGPYSCILREKAFFLPPFYLSLSPCFFPPEFVLSSLSIYRLLSLIFRLLCLSRSISFVFLLFSRVERVLTWLKRNNEKMRRMTWVFGVIVLQWIYFPFEFNQPRRGQILIECCCQLPLSLDAPLHFDSISSMSGNQKIKRRTQMCKNLYFLIFDRKSEFQICDAITLER